MIIRCFQWRTVMTRYFRQMCLILIDAAEPLMLWLLVKMLLGLDVNHRWTQLRPFKPASSTFHLSPSKDQYIDTWQIFPPWWLFLGVFAEWEEQKAGRRVTASHLSGVVQHCQDSQESSWGKGQKCEQHVTGVWMTCKVPVHFKINCLCFRQISPLHPPCHVKLLICNKLCWTSTRFPLAESTSCSWLDAVSIVPSKWLFATSFRYMMRSFALPARLQWPLVLQAVNLQWK